MGSAFSPLPQLIACKAVPLSNRYALHCGTENSRGIEGGCVSEWVEVGSPPVETFTLLMAGMLREAGVSTDKRQGAGFVTHAPPSAVTGDVLVPEPALAEARCLPEDKTGLGSW